MGSKGIVASAAALAVLLQEGIGDTIRISLTPAPGEARTTEVQVAQEILQTMGLRSFSPMVTACPGCGRTTSDYFQHLAQDIQGLAPVAVVADVVPLRAVDQGRVLLSAVDTAPGHLCGAVDEGLPTDPAVILGFHGTTQFPFRQVSLPSSVQVNTLYLTV